MDESGRLYDAGTIVKGSDGQEYIIDELAMINRVSTREETTYETVEETVDNGIKFSIRNVNVLPLLAGFATTLAAYLAAKKKNKDAEEEGLFDSFINSEVYEEFIRKVSEYNKDSKAKRVEDKATIRAKLLSLIFEQKDIVKELSLEDIEELQSIIWDAVDRIYVSPEEIYMDHGEAYYNHNGYVQKIEIDYSKINSIGEAAKVVTEGVIPEEYDNGYSIGGLKR